MYIIQILLALVLLYEPGSTQATTTPVYEYSVEEVIGQYDWDSNIAYRIMMCESGGNPTIVNNNPLTGDYSVGLFQINLYGDNALKRPPEDWLKNSSNNIKYAYELYSNGGWSHWTNCYKQLK